MMRTSLAAALGAGALLVSSAFGIKPYTLVEDGYPERQGIVELEQTFAGSWQLKGDPGAYSIGHEIELEYGLKDDFTLRVAGAYAYEHSLDGSSLHFDEAKLEGQYYFTNSTTDNIGFSFIGAATAGENTMGFEGIFVAQKDFEKWTLTYNLGVATAIDGVFSSQKENSVEGSINNAFGAVYDIGHNVKIGGEISAECIFPDWSNLEKVNVYAGPCINWVPNDRFWVTAGISYNVSGHTDEPRFIGGIIVGIYLN